LLIADGAHDNSVVGNRFGVNRNDSALPNDIGLALASGATQNTIGGPWSSTGCQNPCNLVSGNRLAGVVLQNTGTISNVVGGNLIGLDPTGTAALPNGGPGILITDGASNNTIGGPHGTVGCVGPCNAISGNTGAGIVIAGADTHGDIVQGNFVGMS